jgi:imidazolonepropionase-like amidohydrolase
MKDARSIPGVSVALALFAAAACGGTTDGFPAQSAGVTTLFEGATLIVGDGSPPIESSALLVEGRTIRSVGRVGEVDVPQGASRVDLSGKTIMPAFVDPHSHLGYYDEVTDTEVQDDFSFERVLDHLDRFAYTGHALTYSLGSDSPKLIDPRYSDDPASFVDLRQWSQEEMFTGARYQTVGRALAWPGTGNPRSTVPYPTVSPALAQAAVRELAAQDVGLVKLWIEDRWGFDDPRSGGAAYMTAEIYGPAIEEAHRLGLRTVGHVKTVHDWKDVIRAGTDAITHTVEDLPVDDELLALIRARPGFVNVPVLTSQLDGGSAPRPPGTRPEWLDDPLLGALKCRAFLEEWGRAFEREPPAPSDGGLWAQNTVRVRDAGATLLVGSHDAGGRRTLGWGSHMEMEAFVNWLGMTPHEAIQAATRATAEFVGVADRLGTLEEGKDADFIVLDANPLDDIRNTRRIDRVFLRGREVDRDALKSRWAAACAAAGRA